jgi:hypothetical protein
MKTLILLAGATAFAFAMPAVAKPAHGHEVHGQSGASKSHGKSHASSEHGRHVVTTRNGQRLYVLDARGSCPPGLAKKYNGCMPPGQAKRFYNVGQHYNRSFGSRWTYNQIPDDLRARYAFSQNDRYYYRNGYLYQVDPQTLLIRRVVSALLR